MIGSRHGKHCVAAECLVFDQWRKVLAHDQLGSAPFETHGPIEGLNIVPAPRVRVQIVDEITAANHENSFFTQKGEMPAEFVMKLGRLGLIDAELHHRNVGFRKDVAEHRPRSMIESPALIQSNRNWL